MRRRILHSFAEILWFCILSGLAFAQLQEPLPKMNYDMIPDFFQWPPGEHLVEPAGVAVNSKGHIYVFHRGKHPLMELDSSGKFVRSIADDLFVPAHMVRVDSEDNIWTTDIGSHVVLKLSGRAMARTGLRMMPTFPLKFRTAGFPQYGFKVGLSKGAFQAQGAPWSRPSGLHPSFVPAAFKPVHPRTVSGQLCA